MQYTILDFQKEFPDDDACLDRIFQMKYGDLDTCPKCEKKTKFHRIKGRKQYGCQYCGHQIAPCAGTPFEKSRTSLQKWFYAMYLFTASRHGVPAKELERQLGVTYKTAWRMAHELRKLMAQLDSKTHRTIGNSSGHVEIDETYVGGRKKGVGRGHAQRHMQGVFGIVERDGPIVAGKIDEVSQASVDPYINRYVPWGSTISTDEHGAYKYLDGLAYEHGVVRHRQKEYANGIHHTNTLEGYWSRLKNSIKGTHIHVSPKHVSKYVGEFSFRFNMRKEGTAAMFARLLEGLVLPFQAA